MNEIMSYENSSVPRELRDKTNIYGIKPGYKELAKNITIPQFFFQNHSQLSIMENAHPLDREELSHGFALSTADANVTLE